MKFGAICVSYKRPKELAFAIECFLRQDYPAELRELIVLDDAGQYANQAGNRWRLVSSPVRFRTLGEKRNASAALVSPDITASFTARHPERVQKLVLIDPAGAGTLFLGRLLKLVAAPHLGEAFLVLLGSGGAAGRLAALVFNRELVGHYRERYLVQTRFKGFRQAILSTVRNDMLGSFLETYRQVGRLGKPVLLLWGRHDTTVPLRHGHVLRAAMPDARLHILEGASHIPHVEQPDRTNALLLEFLRE